MIGIDFTFCELREKEVVNIHDGKKLGRIIDMCLHCSGQVVGIVVPGDKCFFKNLNGKDNIFIPWHSIVRIGNDVILVKLALSERREGGNVGKELDGGGE